MREDLSEEYLEKELNVVMLAVLGGPNEKLREALKAWGMMLVHRSFSSPEVQVLVEALEKIRSTNGLGYTGIFDTCDKALSQYHEAIGKK